MTKITEIAWTHANGQNITTVAEEKITEIIEHRAQGEGDRWYYDIIDLPTGQTMRVFTPVHVKFEQLKGF